MFFEKIKSVDVSQTELVEFKAAILAVISDTSQNKKFKEVDTYRRNEHFSQEEAIVANRKWRQEGIIIAEFFGFKMHKVDNYLTDYRFDFIKRVFDITDIAQVAVTFISNGSTNKGTLIGPHVDVIERAFCLNFPICNYEASHTLFYKRTNFDRNTKLFWPSEIEIEHEVQYEPNTIYKINTQIPHSVRLTRTNMAEPRIVLSYAITDNR